MQAEPDNGGTHVGRREEVATPPPVEWQVRTSADTSKPVSSYNILVSDLWTKS